MEDDAMDVDAGVGEQAPAAVVPPQRTREVACPVTFAQMELSFPGVPALITEQLFRDVLTAALTQLHGAVGGAAPFELLSLQGGVGIVRLDKRDVTKVWSAAAFMTQYDGHDARLRVLRATPFLSALAVDSRAWALALALPSAVSGAGLTAQGGG